MSEDWHIDGGTKCFYGIGKLNLCISHIIGDGDIRVRLIACMDDFHIAHSSLSPHLPESIRQTMDSIAEKLAEHQPKMDGHPHTSGLFNGGRGRKGLGIASSLVEEIVSLYVDINRFDAVEASRGQTE